MNPKRKIWRDWRDGQSAKCVGASTNGCYASKWSDNAKSNEIHAAPIVVTCAESDLYNKGCFFMQIM